nr:hypothetical protein [Tanacetum cinerariifolium]
MGGLDITATCRWASLASHRCKDHENVIEDRQYEVDFAIGIINVFCFKSGRSCAGAKAIQSDELSSTKYENYLCELCGNNSHYGYDCQQQFPLVYEQELSYNQNYNGNYYPLDSSSFLCCDNYGGSHETVQCQPMDQNIDSSGFDQIQTP